jgi:hypothetical protein
MGPFFGCLAEIAFKQPIFCLPIDSCVRLKDRLVNRRAAGSRGGLQGSSSKTSASASGQKLRKAMQVEQCERADAHDVSKTRANGEQYPRSTRKHCGIKGR